MSSKLLRDAGEALYGPQAEIDAWQGGPLPGPAVIHALADDQSDEDQ